MTHVGRVRAENQDQFLIADLSNVMRVYQTTLGTDHQKQIFGGSQGKLLLVADGMGGHASGERASSLAVDSISTYLLHTMPWIFCLSKRVNEHFEHDLEEALRHCQRALEAEADAFPQRRGMGTTVTLAYILWPHLYVVHAGDSRCYVFHRGQLQQITRDHTLSQFYADLQGERSQAQRPGAALGNILWNVVGGDTDELTIDAHRLDLEVGDSVILCTDGLSKHVTDDQLAEMLRGNSAPAELCAELIDRANEAGGTDNITAVAARFLPADEDGHHESSSLMDDTAEIPTSPPSGADTDPFLPLSESSGESALP